MNVPLRRLPTAFGTARRHPGLARATALVTLLLLAAGLLPRASALSSGLAHARPGRLAIRSTRIRRASAASLEPAGGSAKGRRGAHAGSKPHKLSGHGSVAAGGGRSTQPAAATARTSRRTGRRRRAQPEPVADRPMPMLRRAGHRPLPARPVTVRSRNLARLRREESPLPLPRRPIPAAADRAATAPYAEGVSHPDDDERLPRTTADDLVSTASAPVIPAANRVSATSRRNGAARRIDGFGAEGLPLASGAASASPSAVVPAPLPAADPAELTAEAVRPMVLPGLYSPDGRLVVPAPLRGSHEILLHQNFMADQAGLERIQDDAELNRMRAIGKLVPLNDTASLRVNPELPYNRRYARPWAARFATDLAGQFFQRFHQPLEVNSAVRTVHYQLRLQRVNGNAAPASGEVASPHLTGQAIDFGKRGMSLAQIAWMRAYLIPLIQAGSIDVEEEFQQACFHISVYRSYVARPQNLPRVEVAQARPASTAPRRSAGAGTASAQRTSASPDPASPGAMPEPDASQDPNR